MFENVDGRRTTDDGVTGILIAHLGAFGSGELINDQNTHKKKKKKDWGGRRRVGWRWRPAPDVMPQIAASYQGFIVWF